MKYFSTRGGIEPVDFQAAVMMGLARDGGLLLPESFPQLTPQTLKAWRKLSYIDLAVAVMLPFVDMPEADLRRLVTRSYATFRNPEITPVVPVGDVFILELFHGPTLAFKDVALQFLGNLFEHVMQQTGQELNILGATSGDTGSAAIYGVRGRERIRIFIMHPHNRISKVQEQQMTSVLDNNVFNLAVEGTFDDCQNIMKAVFNDLAFKDKYALGTVNSINWARLLAQVVYYFYAAFRVMDITGVERVSFSVPTGNFGDIFAGYVAGRMGLPIERLVLATNENDILARFFQDGVYERSKVHATLSPSMDIQVASNFERYLYYRAGADSGRLCGWMKTFSEKGRLVVEPDAAGVVDELIVAGAGDTAQTLTTIRDFYERYNYLLDPHTAVGVHVGRMLKRPGETLICLATAHPAKFGAAIAQAVGRDVAEHAVINSLKDLPTRMDVVPAAVDDVKKFMVDRIHA